MTELNTVNPEGATPDPEHATPRAITRPVLLVCGSQVRNVLDA